MAITLNISYVQTRFYSTLPVVKKIYTPSNKRIIIKSTLNDVDTIRDFDFRNSPVGFYTSPGGYDDLIHDADVRSSDLIIKMACPVADNTTGVTFNQETAVEVSAFDNPTYVFTASGETETVETSTVDNPFTEPTWIPDALTDAEFKTEMQRRIAIVAQILDDGLRPQWADVSTPTNDVFSQSKNDDNAVRWYNTVNWGRCWIGYAWREVKKVGADTNPVTQATALSIVEKCEAEMPNVRHIKTWYLIHATTGWKFYIDSRQIWNTVVENGVGIGGSSQYGTFSLTEWNEIIKTEHAEAFAHTLNL